MPQSCAPRALDAMRLVEQMWKKHKMCYIFRNAPVVQWIGYILAEDTMLVRFQPGAMSECNERVASGLGRGRETVVSRFGEQSALRTLRTEGSQEGATRRRRVHKKLLR